MFKISFQSQNKKQRKAGEVVGKEEEKGIMVFGVYGITVHSKQVYIDASNLTTSEQVQPTP